MKRVPSDDLGIGFRGSNLLYDADSDRCIREITCKTCGALLFSVVQFAGENVDLVWPMKVECRDVAHSLSPREVSGDVFEDAGIIVKSKTVSKYAAADYFKEHLTPEEARRLATRRDAK